MASDVPDQSAIRPELQPGYRNERPLPGEAHARCWAEVRYALPTMDIDSCFKFCGLFFLCNWKAVEYLAHVEPAAVRRPRVGVHHQTITHKEASWEPRYGRPAVINWRRGVMAGRRRLIASGGIRRAGRGLCMVFALCSFLGIGVRALATAGGDDQASE